ncbi:hypothetical protein GTA51_04190 [Desulfovibrio aerotolerans]|uniref:Uncharacterized protein n=1 Tax=Solidesulfovibrio aerotolerans TaxID=295255 RepID=A0A7C9MZG1_9BACT|nr:hypothetical protein [Solidesulfovibrio aerotolerans]MYL82337.1 hypothetical protein [Solidesulfovibrio aerotolerans]
MSADCRLAMDVPSDVGFARVLTAAAEALALRGGFGRRESLRFQLTVEEFFGCLTETVDASQAIRVVLTGKKHLLRAAFDFEAASLSLGGLNVVAAAPACAASEPAGDLGLLLAGKAADRFHIEHRGERRFGLEAEVDKAYPPGAAVQAPAAYPAPFTARAGSDAGQLAYAAALAAAAYPAWHCPGSFQTPGKFADMIEDGQVRCVVATDAAGQPAGLLSWTPCSDRGLYFSGPFVFAPGQDGAAVARVLVEAFLSLVGREKYEIVLSLRATPDAPDGYFESLGELKLCREDACRPQQVLFRHLREDAGLAVWRHPDLEAFLLDAYDRLAMFRNFLNAPSPTSRPRRESLLGANLDRKRDLGELRTLLDGEDLVDNLRRHVAALRQRGLGNIFYYMDLSQEWEAALAGDLTAAGFTPSVVLPHGGRGDLVVWQHVPAA